MKKNKKKTRKKDIEMKNVMRLFAIVISFAVLHTNTLTGNAQEATPFAGDINKGESGSTAVRIEPSNSPLARDIRAALNSSKTRGVRKNSSKILGKVIYFIKPPDNSPRYPEFRENMMSGLRSGQAVGSGDTAFIPIADGSTIRPDDITVTPYNNGGRYPSAGLVLQVLNPGIDAFTLGSVSYSHASSDVSPSKPLGELGFSGNFLTNTLSITRIGVNAGTDAVLGTIDDIIYTSALSTTVIHAIYYRGIANWFEERTPANTGDVAKYIASRQPYWIRTTYTVADLGTVSGMLYIQQAPPPQVPIINHFTADAVSIMLGEETKLRWDVSYAAVSVGGIQQTSQGELVVQPQVTTVYTLVAANPYETKQQTVTVVVTFPPLLPRIVLSFSPNEVHEGDRVTVDWDITEATSASLNGDGSILKKGTYSFIARTDSGPFVFVADGPGGHQEQTLRINVIPTPVQPNVSVYIGLSPDGIVTNGTHLVLEGYVQNMASAQFSLTDLHYELSINSVTNWTRWQSAGFAITLNPTQVGKMGVVEWDAGEPSDNVWNIRASVTVNSFYFKSAPIAIRVVESPAVIAKPISLAIVRQGASVRILLTAPPGTYHVEDALGLIGPWFRGGEALTVTSGKIPEISYTTDERLRFFRVVKAP